MMNTIIFSIWFRKCFLPFVADKLPALLIYDGHSSHISTEIIKEALQNDVIILKLPPHTTDLLQHLDVAVNKSLKDRWDDQLVKWQRVNPRKRIPKQFVGILNKVMNETPKSVVINGFKRTGIFDKDVIHEKGVPVNENVINKKIFNSEDLERYEKYKQEQTENPTEVTTHVEIITAQNVEIENIAAENVEVETEVAVNAPTENAAANNVEIEGAIRAENVPVNNSFEMILLKFINQSKSPEIANKPRRVCPNSEIITTDS